MARLRLGGDNRPRPLLAARLARDRNRSAVAARRQHRILIGRAHRRNALEQPEDLVARQGFIFQQTARQQVEVGLAGGEDLLRPRIAFVDDAVDFRIDLLRRGFRDILGARDAMTQDCNFLLQFRWKN